ncbi:protein of unknown function [Sphingomonas guangdongensis]|uniref:DUF4345 domain-containing protein n=1 Tax=Sphingomonas guangdongensis TaxID=1141890 RepID=A0A285QE03_9SPHN|nr:DUF4345 domain-containing protein [Sphingomonas guangdongensis]SOB80076.1 protein of unknown function [Sphingomonas guangdongensis]
MSRDAEKRLLQAVMAVVLLLPASAVIPSIIGGPRFLGHPPVVSADLDSHFRYLSGLFLALLVLFAGTIPAIERQAARVRLLGAMVVVGGLCRLLSLVLVGVPSIGHQLGLAVELGAVPLLMLWQARLARRYARSISAA